MFLSHANVWSLTLEGRTNLLENKSWKEEALMRLASSYHVLTDLRQAEVLLRGRAPRWRQGQLAGSDVHLTLPVSMITPDSSLWI